MTPDETILKLSLAAVTKHLSELIGACLDDKGKPKAPAVKDLMQARACLPRDYPHSFREKK